MTITLRIERVTEKNYALFDDMISRKENGYGRLSMTGPAKAIRKELKNPDRRIYAMKIDEKYVGWITLVYMSAAGEQEDSGYVYVNELWLEPCYRGYGLDKKLMERAEHFRALRKAAGIRLYVNAKDEETLTMCRALGYGEGDTAILYEKEAERTKKSFLQKLLQPKKEEPLTKAQKKFQKEHKKFLKEHKKFEKNLKKQAKLRKKFIKKARKMKPHRKQRT